MDELKDSQALDLNWIPFVRLIDVVGSIDSVWGSRDSKGRLINDPWPSPFPSSGFDLDAVGVIHNTLSVGQVPNREHCFYDEASRTLRNCTAETGELRNTTGQLIATKMDPAKSWTLPELPQGMYLFCSHQGQITRFVVR